MVIALNKPYGVLSKFTDAEGRPTLADLVRVPGVYPVGRLDMDSEGLLLLTDDARLSRRLTDPRFEHPRTYWVQVEREPGPDALAALRGGVAIQGRLTAPAGVRVIPEPSLWERPVPVRFRKTVPTCWLEIVLREGRNRQLRRMGAAVGHPVLRVVRVAVGGLLLGDLAPGAWRRLGRADLANLASDLR
ncbi:MAG: pseudouridine synthase [Candidatus Sericytochromatia bacterium]|nr:pseudouridine synthase [Candidatus Tanganyikabacteria bacterium]